MKYVNGIWLPDGDTFFTTRPEYELFDFSVAMQWVQGNGLAVDVGAHCGFWSRRLTHKFKHVWSFEPVLDHFACLEKNTLEFENISRFNVALGDTESSVPMKLTIENSGMSQITSNATDDSVMVSQVTLDRMTWDHATSSLDFIKIDVEGHELSVLLGAATSIKLYNPVICVEILPGADDAVPKLLSSWGYKLVARVECNYIWRIS